MATFDGGASFGKATFDGEGAVFDRATFNDGAGFDGATFRRDLPPVWPAGFAEPAGIVWDGPPTSASTPGDH